MEEIEDKIIKRDFDGAAEIWSELSVDIQREYYVQILTSALLFRGHLEPMKVVEKIFCCTREEIRNEKISEVIKLVSTRWNSNGQKEPDNQAIYEFCEMLWDWNYFTYSDANLYYKELANLLKRISIYENEFGEIKTNPVAIESFFKVFKTPFVGEYHKLREVLNEIKTYVDENGHIQYNYDAVFSTLDMFLKDPMGIPEKEPKYVNVDGTFYVQRVYKEKTSDFGIFNIADVCELGKVLKEIQKYTDENGQIKRDDEIVRRVKERVKDKIQLRKGVIDENLDLLKEASLPIQMVINDASELSLEELEYYKNYGLNICSVQIQDKDRREIKGIYSSLEQHYYDSEKYKLCRKKIDEYLSEIDWQIIENDPNREKIIFGAIIKKLAQNVSYDEESNGKIEKIHSTANMEGALLENNCVCSGYAETVRNILACCGIEAIFISGKAKDGGAHAWNKVKLDGVWYNFDLTNARDIIVENINLNFQPRGIRIPYFLESDDEFKIKDKYQNNSDTEEQKCTEKLPDDEKIIYVCWSPQEINRYMSIKYHQQQEFINACVATATISQVRATQTTLITANKEPSRLTSKQGENR